MWHFYLHRVVSEDFLGRWKQKSKIPVQAVSPFFMLCPRDNGVDTEFPKAIWKTTFSDYLKNEKYVFKGVKCFTRMIWLSQLCWVLWFNTPDICRNLMYFIYSLSFFKTILSRKLTVSTLTQMLPVKPRNHSSDPSLLFHFQS